jgi:hypothetical protein
MRSPNRSVYIIGALMVLLFPGEGFPLRTNLPSDAQPRQVLAYRNTVPGVAYVGSNTCARCHSTIFRSYARTRMGRSMTFPGQRPELEKISTPVTVFDQNSDRYFQIWRKGSNFYQSEFARSPNGNELYNHSERIAFAMGAGSTGVSYVIRRGDYLFEAPLSYYSRSAKWGLSPGYGRTSLGFARPILATCAYCHSGRPQPAAKQNGLYMNPPFQQLAIGCESCHGPGQLHVQERLKGTQVAGSDTSVVNPAKLPSWLADNICMGCHEFGDARVLQRRKTFGDFRPGTPLEATLAIFKLSLVPGNSAGSPLLDYYSSMILSKCYRSSGGRLNCLSCHDPHHAPASQQRVAYYRSRCLQCHHERSCRVALAERRRRAPGDNCAVCHMPRHEVQGFSHAMVTSHRIVLNDGEPYPENGFRGGRIPGSGLVLLDDIPTMQSPSVSPLILLQAYQDIVMKHPQETSYRQRYVQLLNSLETTHPTNPLVLSDLARRALSSRTRGGIDRAVRYLKRAVAGGSTSLSDYVILAELLVRMGQPEEAVPPLKQALSLAPYNPLLYQDLAVAYWFTGNYNECSGTAQRGLKLFPEDPVEQAMLKRCQARWGVSH